MKLEIGNWKLTSSFQFSNFQLADRVGFDPPGRRPKGYRAQRGVPTNGERRSCWMTRKSLNGQGGIRTHETLARSPVFETGAFNHSATCPTGRNLAEGRPHGQLAVPLLGRRALKNPLRSWPHSSANMPPTTSGR